MFCPSAIVHVTNAAFVVVSTFTGTVSISFVSGFPLATISAGVVEIKDATVVAFLNGLGVVVVLDVVDLLVVVRDLFVVVIGRFVVVFDGFIVARFVVVLLTVGFVNLMGFVVVVVVRVGFGLVTGGFFVVVLVLFSTVKLETFCTDWNVVIFKGTSVVVVTFFLTVVVGSFSLTAVTGFAVVVFVTLNGGSLGGIIAKSMLLSIIS